MKKILLSLSIILITVFTGCGGGSSSSSSSGGDGGDNSPTSMKLNTKYVMSAGGEITKKSTDADITLETIFATGQTRATLTSGSAECTGCTKVN